MRFLLDTHCWIWSVSEPGKFHHEGAELIENADNTVVFSAVSAFEIAVKTSIGKMHLPEPAETYVTSRVEQLGMSVLPIHLSHALRVARLPNHHTDPFDRLLVAQSQVEDLPLMTADAALAAYDIELIWVGKGRAP